VAASSFSPQPALFLDLGTNGEIVLLAEGRLYATSAAAGPAFEGGNISCGMAALPGAIDTVSASAGRLDLHTIAGGPPKGVCGSGLVDTVMLLLKEGLLDSCGRLKTAAEVSSPLGGRLQERDGEQHFIIYRDAERCISLSQNDIRQVQLAKGAVRAGIEVLLSRAGMPGNSVSAVVITGSFGASLSLAGLKFVGVLTENMIKNAQFVREGALTGVVRHLCNPTAVDGLERLASELRIVPLSGTPLFEKFFLQYLDFCDTAEL
jgi:uncharacterized 2Fe-2S/4Fe-4S cluster protein (DUF4445 family)